MILMMMMMISEEEGGRGKKNFENKKIRSIFVFLKEGGKVGGKEKENLNIFILFSGCLF